MQLDAQLYYQWMYPDSGYQVHPHLTSERTCFRIHALHSGVPQRVRVIYIDDIPVYINGASTQQNIVCDTEKHTLRIRLDYSEVVLENVVLTANRSNEIVFDSGLPSTNMEVIKMKKKIKGSERKLLNKYLLRINSHENAWVSSGDQFWQVRAYRHQLIGPLAKGEKIQVHRKGKPILDLKFDEYTTDTLLKLNKVKLKKRHQFTTNWPSTFSNPKAFFNSYLPLPNLEEGPVLPRAQSPSYGSVFEPNGGAFIVELSKDAQWNWELSHTSDSLKYTRNYASTPSLGLSNPVKAGKYRLKAWSKEEVRVYNIEIKDGMLLNVSKANEGALLVRKKAIKQPTATISGQLFEITKGGNRADAFNLIGEGFYQNVSESLQRNGQYGFKVKAPAPNLYWLKSQKRLPDDILI